MLRLITFNFFSIMFLFCSAYALDSVNSDELSKLSLSGHPNQNNSLAKKAGPTATSYISSYFNVSYTCPTGWTITAFDSTPSSYSLTVTKSLRANIHINGKRFTTAAEANFYNNVSLFTTAKIAYNGSSGKMPGIYSVWDTTYAATGVKSTGINLKYAMDANNIYQSQCHNASESKSIYQHEYWFFTTVSDYTANNTEYSQHWLNLMFGTSTLAKQVANVNNSNQPFTLSNSTLQITADQQLKLKLELFDILGKRIAKIYDSEKTQTNVINLENTTSASSNYLMKATTSEGASYYKIFIK